MSNEWQDSNGDLDVVAHRGTLTIDVNGKPASITYRDANAEKQSVQMTGPGLSLDGQSIVSEIMTLQQRIAEISALPDVATDPTAQAAIGKLRLRQQTLEQTMRYQAAIDAQQAEKRAALEAERNAFDVEARNLTRIAAYRNHVAGELKARGVAQHLIDEIVGTIGLADLPANF